MQQILFKIFQHLLFILLFITAGLLKGCGFFLQSSAENREYAFVEKQFYEHAQKCADETSLSVIYNVGMRGGYYRLPDKVLVFDIPLYRIHNKIIIPTIENIEQEISYGFDEELNRCIEKFSSFKDVQVLTSKIKSVVKIHDEEIVLSVNYPIAVIRDERKNLLEDLWELKIPLGRMHRVATEIVKTEDLRTLCYTCVARLMYDNDFVVDIINYDKNASFLIIRSKELNGRAFEFAFAMEEE